jgi:hypothetical protein
METNQPVAPGTRYRNLQATVFGQPQPEWIVKDVYMAAGIEHARLVSAANPAERKTLSVSILRDRGRFERVEVPTPD